MGIEETLKIEDVLKEPQEIVIAKTYIQARITNGTVKRLDSENDCRKDEIEKLNVKVDDKIGIKAFTKISIILTVILSLLMILSSTVGILNIIFGK